MRMLMTAAAAVMAATAMVSSASAAIGCDPGEALGTLNAKSCRVWNNAVQAPSARESFAMAPRAYAAAPRGVYDTRPLDGNFFHHTDVSGGANG
jgi:hypothetical protein